jgi:hypothetical protein
MKVLLALEFGFIWIFGRWHQRGFEKTPGPTTQKMDLQVDEYKWRARALRYPQAGRETVFPGHASGVAAVFSSSRGWSVYIRMLYNRNNTTNLSSKCRLNY